ncbi:MAG: cohesin domain-containing protein [Candidatus Coproplasma sp.]
MKKLLFVLAAVTLTFFSLSVTLPAMATSSARISFNDVAAYKGETVEITLCLSDCPKIKSMAVVPLYDLEKLEYIDGEWLIGGALLSDWNNQEQNGVILYSSETDLNGDIAKFTFKIIENESWEDIDFSCKVVIKNGTEQVDVEVDNHKIEIICDHDWSSTVFTENPTCVQPGSTYKVCSICNRKDIITTIEKLPHTLSDWIIDKEPTINEQGKRHKECTVCNNIIVEEDIPVLGQCDHIWGDEIFEQQATCTENGMIYKVCTICSEKYILYEFDKTEHVLGEWIIDKEPTTDEQGKRHKECTVCNNVIVEEDIPVLGYCDHIWSDDIYEQQATCTENGMLYKVCAVCSEKYILYEFGKTEHVPGEWITDREATLELEGEKHKECVNCGEIIEWETIQKLDKQGLSTAVIIVISVTAGAGVGAGVFFVCRFIWVKRRKY